MKILANGEFVGWIAETHPNVTKKFGIDGRVGMFEIPLAAFLTHRSTHSKYVPIPAFPPVKRDLALVVAESVEFGDLHAALASGSALLKEVGELLIGSTRQLDLVFRYGGDEFALLLVETAPEGAMTIATRIRDAFRSRRFMQKHGLELRLTASLGVATFPDHAPCALDLVRAADFAMYAAKARGRDDVCVAQALETTQPVEPAPGADVTG